MRLALTISFVLFLAEVSVAQSQESGLRPGESVSAWEPIHVAGPHKGTKTCPVCTYLDAPLLLVFARDELAAKSILKPLEEMAVTHSTGKLHVLLLVVDGSDAELQAIAADQKLKYVMLCRPDPAKKEKQLKAYKIDPSVENTVMLYQNYVVKKTWVGLKPADLHVLKDATDEYLPIR